MRINQITTNINPPSQSSRTNQTAFKSSFRSVYKDTFVLKYNTNTCFFRPDLNWRDFVDYLSVKYKNTDKINVINYACSTGEEPSSLAMILDVKLGENANKFLPIRAYDIEEENINCAKRGQFGISMGEIDYLKDNIGEKYKEYFETFIQDKGNKGMLFANDKLKSKVIYEQSDILKNIDKIPAKNTVLLCRNFLPYLTIGEQTELVHKIGKKLKSSSVVVLGNFELTYGVEKLFEKEGFRHTKQYNVMEKLPAYKALLSKIIKALKIK